MSGRYVRVVSLWVRPGQEGAFELFEREAARLMASYGGRIDQAIRVRAPHASSFAAGESSPYEIHVVSFPDCAAFEAYRQAPETGQLAGRRAENHRTDRRNRRRIRRPIPGLRLNRRHVAGFIGYGA